MRLGASRKRKTKIIVAVCLLLAPCIVVVQLYDIRIVSDARSVLVESAIMCSDAYQASEAYLALTYHDDKARIEIEASYSSDDSQKFVHTKRYQFSSVLAFHDYKLLIRRSDQCAERSIRPKAIHTKALIELISRYLKISSTLEVVWKTDAKGVTFSIYESYRSPSNGPYLHGALLSFGRISLSGNVVEHEIL